MRNYDRNNRTRQTALSDDGGLTWHDQRHDPVLIEPICQASIRRLRWPGAGQGGVILFSNPGSQAGREKMTVRVSDDDAKTWSHSKLINDGFSAYSSLERIDDQTAGLLYEGAVGDEGYGRITFVRLGLEWLTETE
jgi:sialidase-1